jgi:hypothetical protein
LVSVWPFCSVGVAFGPSVSSDRVILGSSAERATLDAR